MLSSHIFNNLSDNAFNPNICVRKIALVLSVIAFSNLSKSKDRFFKFISTNTVSKPANKTELISDIQVRGGSITFPPSGYIYPNANIVNSLAAVPELTKTLCFTPNHLDHFSSNSTTFGPFVNLGIGSCCKNSTRQSISSLLILSDINGNFNLFTTTSVLLYINRMYFFHIKNYFSFNTCNNCFLTTTLP